MVLLAICHAKYCFTYADFGQYGSANDSSVFRSSGLYKAFEENKFNVSVPTEAGGFEDPLPYFLLGNEMFPLKTWLMRPFPGSLDDSQKIFNYQLSTKMHLVFWSQDGGFLNDQYVLPVKLSTQSLGLVFVVTAIYKQHNHRLIQSESYHFLKRIFTKRILPFFNPALFATSFQQFPVTSFWWYSRVHSSYRQGNSRTQSLKKMSCSETLILVKKRKQLCFTKNSSVFV